MTQGSHGRQGQVVTFGPFRLLSGQRLLMEGEKRIRLGSRALEILLLLVERAGELVAKHELLDRVGPNIAVDETALRVHIAARSNVERLSYNCNHDANRKHTWVTRQVEGSRMRRPWSHRGTAKPVVSEHRSYREVLNA